MCCHLNTLTWLMSCRPRALFCSGSVWSGLLQVRREFLGMLAEWLLELPERAEHRPRLLPYLLALLADPAPTLAAAAADALGALGAQYEREHVKELKARRFNKVAVGFCCCCDCRALRLKNFCASMCMHCP